MGSLDTTLASKSLPITQVQFDEAEEQAVLEVLRSGWIVQGPRVAEFERRFADFVGCEFAVATSSCTTSLHLALLAAGIGPGDKVIVPSLTYIATANAVEYVGAQPIFADIDPCHFTIDIDSVRRLLEGNNDGNVKAIIPVSLFGLCADMPEVNSLAEEFGLIVIEDAACGMGGYRQGHHAGTEAEIGVFSLHPRKAITTGEGGVIVTNNEQYAETMRSLRNHGASMSDMQRHLQHGGSLLPEFNMLGYNYRMTDIQGAIGIAQMRKASGIFAARREAAQYYNEILKDIDGLYIPQSPENYRHAYQSYVCYFGFVPEKGDIDLNRVREANIRRNRLMAELEQEGISVRQGTHAVHTLGFYRNKYGLTESDCPAAFAADRLSIALPLFPGILTSDQHRVAETIKRLLII
ncbi:MAG: DegT/DnrJ/EryC1/StrS family aminotransferase [Candidatus Zixiibacteriota bacterium]